ncbi:hypothetical protein, partial [Stieleria sp.]|uniref:hypothetical protein n=1 Tax=Stieleria sp. TaxID=2795976 RepID=UPI0035624D60
ADPNSGSTKGPTTCFAYDVLGNLIATGDPRNGADSCDGSIPDGPLVTVREYDSLSRLKKRVNAAGYTEQRDYDPVGNLIERIDPRGFVTTYEYDKLGHLTKETRQAGPMGEDDAITHYVYDAIGQLRRQVDPRGDQYWTEFEYDALHRLIETRVNTFDVNLNGEVLRTKFTHDKAGNVATITDPRGDFFTVEYEHNAKNRVVKQEMNTGSEDAPGPRSIRRYGYDAAGNQTSIVDPRGTYYTTTMTYDERGMLSEISQPTGNDVAPGAPAITSYTYDGAGRTKTIELPWVNTPTNRGMVTYEYDARGLMIAEIDPEENRVEYSHDAAGNVVHIKRYGDEFTASREETFVPDALGRTALIIDADGRETRMTYDENNNLTRVVGPMLSPDGTPYEQTWTYDAQNFPITHTDAEGYTTTTRFDLVGNPIETTDPRGPFFTTYVTYDARNLPLETRRPAGAAADSGQYLVDQFFYDGANNQIRHVDPRGPAFATTVEYDTMNHPVKTIRAGGDADNPTDHVDEFEYDVAGNRIAYTDPRGEEFTSHYTVDFAGRTLTSEYPSGDLGTQDTVSDQKLYDGMGNLIRHVDIGGEDYVTTFQYDLLGRQVLMTDPVNESEASVYDAFGNVVTVTNTHGTTQFRYDALDRNVLTIDALGHESSSRYEANGSRRIDTNPRGFESKTIVDGLNRITVHEDEIGGITETTYDGVGNVVSMTDPRGIETVLEYDARNLLVASTSAAGTDEALTRTMQYDVLGNLIAETDPRGGYFTTNYIYDNLSRVVEIQMPAGLPGSPGIATPGYEDKLVRKLTYTPLGSVASETSTRGAFYETIYSYDRQNRLVQIDREVGTPGASQTATVLQEYNDAGNLISMTDANGFVTNSQYDLKGRRTRQEILSDDEAAGAEGKFVNRWEYVDRADGYSVQYYDATGKLDTETVYDALGRATAINSRSEEPVTLDYDENGNLIAEASGRVSFTYQYDPLDRRVVATDTDGNSSRFEYDANGNLERVFDAFDVLIDDSQYDLHDRRTSTTNALGQTTHYAYDGADNLVSVRDSADNVTSMVRDALNRLRSETTSQGI